MSATLSQQALTGNWFIEGPLAMKLKEQAKAIGLKDYSTVAMGVRRYAVRLTLSPKDQKELHRAIQLLNVKV